MTGRFRGAWLAAVILLAPGLPAAVEPSERLADPALEARARALSAGLRCLVCQNETIDESNAPLAHDLRVLVRERLTAGDSDAQAKQAIVDRYGDFVLLKPPVRPVTWLLWFGPVAILVAAAAGSLIWVRRRANNAATAAPLTEAEQARLNAILREPDR